MPDRRTLILKLLGVLADIDFDRRYYAFYDARREREKAQMKHTKRKDFEVALQESGLEFDFDKTEKTFNHHEIDQRIELGLTVSFPYSAVDLILHVTIDGVYVGGPYTMLASEIAEQRDPSFSRNPAAPRLPFSNRDEMHEVVRFGIELWRDAKRTILAQRWED